MSNEKITSGDKVKIIDDKKPEFDQLFSGKPCMNSGLGFNVVSKNKNTLTIESELAGTFESDHTNKAHRFDANVGLFELSK